MPITDIFEKEKRVDGIIDTTKERIHIEINSDTKDYYRMRNFLYFAAIMLEDIKRGKNYNPKKKYIHISLDLGKEELVDFAERTDNKMMKKYKDEITKLNDDTIVIKSLTYEEDREMLMNAIKEDYLEERRELGVKEGQNQTKLETAKKLLEMNMSLDDIVNVTGLKKKNVIEIKSCMI